MIELFVDVLEQVKHALHVLAHITHRALQALHAGENGGLGTIIAGSWRLLADGVLESTCMMERVGEQIQVRLPPLQFLDAHHHVDVPVRVLLEDVANIVRLSGLLESISSDNQLDFSNASNHAFVIVGQS